ncbi:ATP-binding protein [Candidatus Desantisbacteria bacterium]|nr:ATP-binding protein [Candidatus Desantisbacteria bacterium]
MKSDITFLGKIINVNSNTVEAEISKEIPSSAPIINGRVHRIGQIGTLVKIPIGNLLLFGIVSSVSNSPSTNNVNLLAEPDYGHRFIQIQLLGEKLGNNDFVKGVGGYPTINDEVHLVLDEDLKGIYGGRKDGYIEIGRHSSSDTLSIYLDLKHLVLRHSAVLGSTGSGKSNATANIAKKILTDYPGSRIILVDPHGEYSSAFDKNAKIFKINNPENPLFIPFWTMTFDELSFFLVGRQEGQEKPEDKKLREEIVKLKRLSADKLKAGKINPEFITADSPIPFNLKELWYTFNREVNATYKSADQNSQTKENEELDSEGDPDNLKPAKFKPYSPTNSAPYKAKEQTMYAYEKKIHSRLKDSKFDFMFNPGNFATAKSKDDIDEMLRLWIDHEHRLTILDLNGIPFELIDISVGLITRFIFDSMYWGRFEEYTGRNRPLLMIYEEAHAYLPKTESSSHIYGYARKAVEKIFKEGRKFGIGAMVVTQRPSEISETILAQVGTVIALRLTNTSDKNSVQAVAPNNMSSLMELLPSLRVGEAIVVGESIVIPSRVRIDLIEPRPSSTDPELVESWKKQYPLNKNHYKKIITALREQKHIKKEKT